MKKDKLPLIAVIIALVGVVAPISWDRWKSSSELELHQLAQTILVNKETKIDKLEILYNGKPISQVSRLTFLLKNSGRIPIEEAHLKTPPTITFDQDIDVLEYIIDKKSFQNLIASQVFDPQSNSLSVNFPLLNPDDYVQFSVVIAGDNINYKANARITNIREMIIVEKEVEPSSLKGPISWIVYLIGFVAALFLFVGLDLIKKQIKLRELKKNINNDTIVIPEFENFEQCQTFIIKYLYTMGKSDNKRLLGNLPDFGVNQLSNDQQTLLRQTIINHIENKNFVPSIIFSISIVLIAVSYIYSNIM